MRHLRRGTITLVVVIRVVGAGIILRQVVLGHQVIVEVLQVRVLLEAPQVLVEVGVPGLPWVPTPTIPQAPGSLVMLEEVGVPPPITLEVP